MARRRGERSSRREASEERSEASSRSAGVPRGHSSPAISSPSGWPAYLLLFAFALPTAAIALGSFAAFVSIAQHAVGDRAAERGAAGRALAVSSYDWAISLVFMPIGFALWGPISELVGVDTAFVAAAVVSAAAKIGPVLVPDVRNLRRVGRTAVAGGPGDDLTRPQSRPKAFSPVSA